MRTSSTRLAASAALIGLVALSACGSDSNDTSSATTAPASQSTDAAAPTTDATKAPTTDATKAPTTDAMTGSTDAASGTGNIVDVAVANGSFKTLVAAVKAADLVDALSAKGPLTVFAPTDDAFKALPAGLVDCLLLPANKETLATILKYHVVDGAVMSTDLKDGPVPTLQGEDITVSLSNGDVTLNKTVKVVTADVKASNGVIHAIDGVLVPPTIDVAAFLKTCPA